MYSHFACLGRSRLMTGRIENAPSGRDCRWALITINSKRVFSEKGGSKDFIGPLPCRATFYCSLHWSSAYRYSLRLAIP